MIIVSYSLFKSYLLSLKNVSPSSSLLSLSSLNQSSKPPGYSMTFEYPEFIRFLASSVDALHSLFSQYVMIGISFSSIFFNSIKSTKSSYLGRVISIKSLILSSLLFGLRILFGKLYVPGIDLSLNDSSGNALIIRWSLDFNAFSN